MSAAINLAQAQECNGHAARFATVALWVLTIFIALKIMLILVVRQTWTAFAGFAVGTGAAMEAGGGYESSVVAGLVAGAVTIGLKVLGIWWESRKSKKKTTETVSIAQQQSADKVAELTANERQELRELMNDVYGRERALLELQMNMLQAQRTQDVAIIDSLSSQLRITHERVLELESRQAEQMD
jgi:hypothetical protein